MRTTYISLFIICAMSLFSSCVAKKVIDNGNYCWTSVAEMEDSEIFVDTSSIKREGTMVMAREKKVYTTNESKEEYISNIRDKYTSLGQEKKALKWTNLSYTIYTSKYDCLNSRFRILSIEDYDSQGVRIIRTTPNKKDIKWLNVDEDTVGDYTFFFVCDYEY